MPSNPLDYATRKPRRKPSLLLQIVKWALIVLALVGAAVAFFIWDALHHLSSINIQWQ
jgi:hypothetical protein